MILIYIIAPEWGSEQCGGAGGVAALPAPTPGHFLGFAGVSLRAVTLQLF
jgi:hypothetical protein